MGIFDRFKKQKTEDKVKEAKPAKKAKAPVEPLKVKSEEKTDTAKYATLKAKGESSAPQAGQEIKTKKAKKDDTGNAYRILVKPLITEKATNLVSLNKYAFKVSSQANKVQISQAIKAVYGFAPVSVNIINARGKRVVSGRVKGKKSNWKKAIVTLKPGDKLEIYEGV